MHLIQEKILAIADYDNLANLSLREIASRIGEDHPQKIKHHLEQLKKKGLIRVQNGEYGKFIERVREGADSHSELINIPIYGAANCGPAKIFADEQLEGFLKVSPHVLREKRNIFALRAEGNSMNKASIRGEKIEDGDYVIISENEKAPSNGDYILTVIDGRANIKKYLDRKERGVIVLVSESTENYPPIYLSAEDDFYVNGKVTQVFKGERSLNWP